MHIVPHSYNTDFLRIVDEYFSAEKNDLLLEHYTKVFNNIAVALAEDPHRTFTHYEVRYFSHWYSGLKPIEKDLIKRLVKGGQIEFVNCGWEMHDTVCPHYTDMLLNIQRGH